MRSNSVRCCVLFYLTNVGVTVLLGQQPSVPTATPNRLSVEMATEILLVRNPTLLRERQNIAVARGNLVEARKLPNPGFSVSSESYPLFESRPGSFLNNSESSFRVDQTIETAGKRRKRTAVAEKDIQVNESSLQDTVRLLKLELKERYFGVSLAKAQYELAQQVLSDYDNTVKINEARFKQGEVSGFEFSRLQTERLRFFNDVVEAELQLKNAKVALLELLGADPSATDFDVTEALVYTPPPVTLEGLRNQAMQTRADLNAQRRRVERESRELTFQKSQAIPNVTPGFGYKRDFGQNTVAFGVTVPLPFFNRNQGGVARAVAQLEQQRHEQDRVQLAVSGDVQQAFNTLQAETQRVQALQNTYVPSAQRARDISQASYRLGALDLVGFLDAQRSYRETLRTYNEALYEQRAAISQLEAAVGRDF